MSEGLSDLVWVVWGDLALLYMSLILLLRFPGNTGMPFVLAKVEVGNKQTHAGFLRSRLSTGTLVSFSSFCWPKQVTHPRPDSRDEKTDMSFKWEELSWGKGLDTRRRGGMKDWGYSCDQPQSTVNKLLFELISSTCVNKSQIWIWPRKKMYLSFLKKIYSFQKNTDFTDFSWLTVWFSVKTW